MRSWYGRLSAIFASGHSELRGQNLEVCMYDNITTSYSRHTLERLQESHSQIQPWTIVVSSYKYMSDRSGRIGGHERMGRALAHNSRFEKWTVVFTELGPAHNNLFTWKSSLQMVLRGEAVQGIALASKERLSSRGTSPRVPFIRHVLEEMRHWLNGHGDAENIWMTRSTIQQFSSDFW